jgi:hypothetical protein
MQMGKASAQPNLGNYFQNKGIQKPSNDYPPNPYIQPKSKNLGNMSIQEEKQLDNDL